MKSKTITKNIIFQLACLFCIFIFAIVLGNFISSFKSGKSLHQDILLDEGWTVERNGVMLGEYTLSDSRFDIFSRGEELIITNILPDTLPNHPIMRFYNVHSAISIYVGDEERYSYGWNEYSNEKLLGYGYHYISLQKEDAGKTIRIVQRVTENDAFSSLDAPVIGDSDFFLHDYLISNAVRLSIIVFLILFGFVVAAIAVIYMFKDRKMVRLLGVGLFSVAIGSWSLCTTDLIELFTYNLNAKSFIEYFSLYLAPLFLFIYFIDEIKEEGKIIWWSFRSLMVAECTFVVAALMLQLTGLVRFPSMLIVCHILLATSVSFLVIRFFVGLFKGNVESSPLVFGFEFLAIFAIYDLMKFNLIKYLPIAVSDHYDSMIYIGVLVFVITMLIDFCIKYLRKIYKQAEEKTLKLLAYTDYLTGLGNRRTLEDKIAKVLELDSEFTFIGFDLNDLKKVNDTMGHKEGDRYLMSFANVLMNSFGNDSTICRTGGDEFVVILDSQDEGVVNGMIDDMLAYIRKVNLSNADWNMSSAYGICRKCEADKGNIGSALKIADERMYVCKQRMKSEAEPAKRD